MDDKVADGILFKLPQDRPGKRCHYIQPGATETEVYRISTFRHYPEHVPVDPMVLAKYGFYFIGYEDRVKCFSCSLAVQDWSTNDNPRSTKWHLKDCNLVRGTETRNVQISTVVGRPLEFVREYTPSGASSDIGTVDFSFYNNSFSSTSSRSGLNGNVPNVTTGFSGVNFNGNNLFSCGANAYQTAVTNPKIFTRHQQPLDNLKIVNERCSTVNCLTEEGQRLVSNNEQRNIPIRSELSIAQILKSPPDPSPEEQQRLDLLFPSTNPTTPNMSSYENRLRSFTSRWDKTKVKATIELIAEAGFFYLGDRDRAKCFYCNGGLQNWDRDDEPWTEHAKWFPGCEFILRSKGIEFAREMFLKYPDLPRFNIQNERFEYQPGGGATEPSNHVAAAQRMLDEQSTQSARESLHGPTAASQAVADRRQHLNQSASVSQIQRIKTQAMEMGFLSDAITKAIQNRAAKGNGEYTEVQQLLDDLFELEEITDLSPDNHDTAIGSQTSSTSQQQTPQTTITNAISFHGCDFTIGLKGIEFLQKMLLKNPNMLRLNVQNNERN